MSTMLHRNADTGALLTRAIPVKPNSFNAADRSFAAAILATATPVARRGYTEVLDLGGAQLPESLPIVLDHRADVRSTVGRMSNLRVQGSELIGDGRLSGDASLGWLCDRISDGTVGALSVGFTVERWQNGANNTRTAVSWRPVHAALVSSPADDRARIRSSADDDFENGKSDTCVAFDPSERRARIRSLSRALGLSRDIENRALDEEWSDDQLMDAVLKRGGRLVVSTRGHDSLDDPEVYRRAMVDGLVARITGADAQGAARELASLSWAELHRRHLRHAGQSVSGFSDQEIISRALSTSDLPLIAGDVVGVAIGRTYEAQASPIM